MIILLIAVIAASFVFVIVNYRYVARRPSGTAAMQQIALAIRDGANTFLYQEYRLILIVALMVAFLLTAGISWFAGICFLLGALMSACAGWVGMRIATTANVRVSNTARTTKKLSSTLKVAFGGGSVMGLAVSGFALLGLLIVYLVFGKILGQINATQLVITYNYLGIPFIPFAMSLSTYALGCSMIAMFNRVGGGIYTKAADMGADLVGKTEAGIPEDDPRNPATIADNVGDNVGDVAGLGADILESYVGAIISCIVLTAYFFQLRIGTSSELSAELVSRLIEFPLIFASVGVIGSMCGIFSIMIKRLSDKPHRELNLATFISAIITIVISGVVCYYFFNVRGIERVDFVAGPLSPWIASVLGILSGIAIGQLAEYYTSSSYKPTRRISEASLEGAALNITQGLAIGMRSVALPILALTITVLSAHYIAGIYGVAMAALGMLSFVATTVSVDTYGPIADNAGGISEMSKLKGYVRNITDTLDSVGNTTAAIGKGFAIGSAALATLSLFVSFLFSLAEPGVTIDTFQLLLNVVHPLSLAGALIGAALPFLFSGILIDAVAKAARKMVQEVRRQFKENPKILKGKDLPDYTRCIKISSSGALAEMRAPALLALLSPLIGGFIFGPQFVGGLLIGTTLSAIMLALFSANSGGAWDNAKKYIEEGHHGGKGSAAHSAGVIGDTVGDPLKDTVGPSLNILIKIMATISLIAASLFSSYNLVGLF